MHYVRHNRLGWRRIRADAGKKCKSGVGPKHPYKTALSKLKHISMQWHSQNFLKRVLIRAPQQNQTDFLKIHINTSAFLLDS
jgi:hypothetical protein